MFKKFKSDWKVATIGEKLKFISVLALVLISAIISIYYLIVGTQGDDNSWNAREILYSYTLFILFTLLSRINTKPKAKRNNNEK